MGDVVIFTYQDAVILFFIFLYKKLNIRDLERKWTLASPDKAITYIIHATSACKHTDDIHTRHITKEKKTVYVLLAT